MRLKSVLTNKKEYMFCKLLAALDLFLHIKMLPAAQELPISIKTLNLVKNVKLFLIKKTCFHNFSKHDANTQEFFKGFFYIKLTSRTKIGHFCPM